MRLIDADALKKMYGLDYDCAKCEHNSRDCQFSGISRMDICSALDPDESPTIEAIPIDKAAEFLANYQAPVIKFPEGKYFVVMSHEEVVQEWKKILMEAMEK